MIPTPPETLAFRAARGVSDADAALDGAVRKLMREIDPSREYPPLTAFRVTFDDGSTQETSMAAGVTLAEAQAHYVGQRFEITETTFRTAVSVVQIR